MFQDKQVIEAALEAGNLLRKTFVLLNDVVPRTEKIRALEALRAAQRRAYDLASSARSSIVKADDLVTPLANTLLMLADEYGPSDPERAAAIREEARSLVEHGSVDQRVDHLRSSALAAQARGEFAVGLDLMMEAERLLDVGAAPLKVARVTMDRVDMLQQLGDFDTAATGVEKIRHMFADGKLEVDPRAAMQALQQHVERARLLLDIEFQTGLIELGRHNYDVAAAAIERAAEYAKPIGQPTETIRYQLARIALQRGDTRNVDVWLDGAEAVIGKVAPHRLSVVQLMRGWASLLRGDTARATVLLEDARHRALAVNDWETHAKASWRLAQATHLTDPAIASRAHREACSSYDRARRAPLGYRMDNLYLADKYPAFIDAIRWFVSRDEPEAALEVIEQVKSRRLTAVLATDHEGAPEQPEAAELLKVTRQLDAIGLQNPKDQGPVVQALEARRQALIDQMRRSDPRFRNLTLPALDVPGLQRCLARLEACALELFMPDDGTVVAVLVTPTRLRVATKSLDAPKREALDRFVDNLRQKEPADVYFDISGGLGVGMADLVPSDLIADALTGRRLLVAPHRELHVVPWAALTNDDQRICERIAVGVVPCVSCIPALATDLSPHPIVQLFGPPVYPDPKNAMPDYEREMDAMSARLGEQRPGHSRGPTLESANVSTFLEVLGERTSETMLFVACHGTFDAHEPLRSSLLMADGGVDAANIMMRRTHFEEVVLRACSTGDRVERVGGLDLVGDDILGLPGAFIEAGARAVVVSIPPLPRRPTARRLFERYLSWRSRQQSPLLALQSAQRAALDEGDDPVDWAGVTVYGVQ